MSCVGSDEGIEDVGSGSVMIGSVVFGVRHTAAQSTSGRLRAACNQGR
jgi:hypothetical protein